MDGASPATLTILASGSSGNAAIVRCGEFGLLIDLGIGPRTLARRLAAAGLDWNNVHAIALTHTHGDHWRENSLAQAAKRSLPVYCHDSHAKYLKSSSNAFGNLSALGHITVFVQDRSFSPGGGLRLTPLELAHDSHRTFGFRIEADEWAIAYVADLGEFDDHLVDQLRDVKVVALECNHDERMQHESGRPQELIARVLGPRGHLSNRQAGDLLTAILAKSRHTKPHTVVPLHLSRECNVPKLAETEMLAALEKAQHPANVVISRQDCVTANLPINNVHSSNAGITAPAGDNLSPAIGVSTPPRQE
jgi:phosphoribosyl 1,2-cyclic phosphodiesterase